MIPDHTCHGIRDPRPGSLLRNNGCPSEQHGGRHRNRVHLTREFRILRERGRPGKRPAVPLRGELKKKGIFVHDDPSGKLQRVGVEVIHFALPRGIHFGAADVGQTAGAKRLPGNRGPERREIKRLWENEDRRFLKHRDTVQVIPVRKRI